MLLSGRVGRLQVSLWIRNVDEYLLTYNEGWGLPVRSVRILSLGWQTISRLCQSLVPSAVKAPCF
jgi:hypothetical protein